MEEDRWEKLDDLLEGALERPSRDRASYLREACGDDGDLLAEAQKLLALAEREDDILSPESVFAGPIGLEIAQELSSHGTRRVEVGDRVGVYRLVRLLGRGGMGQVFAAEDTKLGRHVALKLLPPEIASEERRRRFDREAKAVAALNHPNIVHLYTIEETDGLAFITMELVEGETLADSIPEGGLPLRRFFSIALPLANALSAAHEGGVVHRDLKPGNVMIGKDGQVKVLDFGLAKTRGGEGGALPELGVSETGEGHIVGTVSHMSPEQAEGKAVDHRSDIFALGVVLYEMATGHPPFTGDSPTAVISSILRDTPQSVTEVNPAMPRELGRIIKRCLAKDADRRYQSARDVVIELEELAYELDSRKLFQPSLQARGGSWPLVSGVVAAASLAALAIGFFARGGVETGDVELLSGTFSQITSDPGAELFPTLSPDGSFLAYSSRAEGNSDVYLLRAAGRRPINLTESSLDDDSQPAFSPDGNYIAFQSSRQGGGIFVMGSTGESARRVVEHGWNPAWSPDGSTLVFATAPISRSPFDRPSKSELWTVGLEDRETKRLFEGDAVQPSWSPHGHRIAFWGLADGGAERDIFTVAATGGEAVAVTRDDYVDWNPVWSPDGEYIYFASDRGGSMNLWRVPIDERSGATRDEPEPVRAPASFATHIAFSRDGRHMAYASGLTTNTLGGVSFDPETGTVGGPLTRARELRDVASPRVSPDGEWIAYSREGGQEDVILVRRDGTGERMLTDDPARDRFPRWSPDGGRIAFYSNRSGTYEIWTIEADGSALAQLTDLPRYPTRYPAFSPDGARLFFSSPGTAGFIIDPNRPWSEQAPEELPPFPFEGEEFIPFDWSPDGTRIAGYLLLPNGVRAGIGVYELETGRYEKLTDFGLMPFWLPDSRRMIFQGLGPGRSTGQSYYELDFRLFLLDRQTKEVRELLALDGASAESPVLSPDGEALYFVRSAFESDVWMLSATEAPP